MNESWFKNRPVSIFIDNSVFRAMNFNFSHPSFRTVEKAVESGDIEILYTEISKGEFLKHVEELLRDEEEKIRRIGVVRSIFNDEIEKLHNQIKDLGAINLWEKFTRVFNAKNISCQVQWQSIFSDYFALKTPFTAKKKDEFPDAFNIKMIEAFNPSRLVIISADNDYKSWAGSRQNTSLFTKLDEFSNAYLKSRDSIFAEQSSVGLEALCPLIIEKIKEDYSDNSHYEVTCGHSEILYANVSELDVVESDLVATSHEDMFAVFILRFRGKTRLELNCPVVIWDSIDKEEITLGSNSRHADVEIEINATVTVFVNEKDAKDSDFEITEDELHAEDFEVPSEWTTFLDDRDHD